MDERMNVYSIKEGDILKVGRIVIRIRAIIFKKNNENHVHIENKLKLIQTEKNTIKSKVSKEEKEPEPDYKSENIKLKELLSQYEKFLLWC